MLRNFSLLIETGMRMEGGVVKFDLILFRIHLCVYVTGVETDRGESPSAYRSDPGERREVLPLLVQT